jgi:competence protein ComEC
MVLGLCLARETTASTVPIAFALGTALLLAGISLTRLQKHTRLWTCVFISATSLTFWAYGSLRLPAQPSLAEQRFPMREAQLHFSVERVMQARNAYGKATGIGRIIRANHTSRLNPDAKIYFRLDLTESDLPKVQRGSELRATGVLSCIPDQIPPDSFDAYLKDTGVHYRFTRSSELEQVRPPTRFDQFCQRSNEHFQRYLRLGAPEDSQLDSIYVAMLLGLKTELNPTQKDRFRMTGTMHFFAISGLHIGVIATVIAQFLILIRVPRKLGPWIGLPLLYLYVEITGAAPSAVRAFLMAVFFWTSFAFTRQRTPLPALAASAVFVLLFRPDQLWSIGFQLSYTVVLSILLFGLPLYQSTSERFAPYRYLPKANWSQTQRTFAWAQAAVLLLFCISLSAWLASAPLSAGFFGFISPGAILLNMLLVNLAALAISSGIIALSFGMLGLESFTAFVNHAAWMSIYTMDQLVQWSIQIPGMSIKCAHFSEWIAYSILTAYFALLLYLHHTHAFNKSSMTLWILPPLLVVGGLFLGLI